MKVFHIAHHSTPIITMQLEPTSMLHLQQIIPTWAGNAMLGTEEILVTST